MVENTGIEWADATWNPSGNRLPRWARAARTAICSAACAAFTGIAAITDFQCVLDMSDAGSLPLLAAVRTIR